MSVYTSLKVIVLATLTLAATSLWAIEPLSEADLDRTVASGFEPTMTLVDPTTSHTADRAESIARSSVPGAKQKEEALEADEDAQTSEGEFSLVAYRSALPVVMKGMTGANNGPLAANGRYSLSPLTGSPARPTKVPTIDLRLAPRLAPSRPVFFGR